MQVLQNSWVSAARHQGGTAKCHPQFQWFLPLINKSTLAESSGHDGSWDVLGKRESLSSDAPAIIFNIPSNSTETTGNCQRLWRKKNTTTILIINNKKKTSRTESRIVARNISSSCHDFFLCSSSSSVQFHRTQPPRSPFGNLEERAPSSHHLWEQHTVTHILCDSNLSHSTPQLRICNSRTRESKSKCCVCLKLVGSEK